jgi:hypothetical protein
MIIYIYACIVFIQQWLKRGTKTETETSRFRFRFRFRFLTSYTSQLRSIISTTPLTVLGGAAAPAPRNVRVAQSVCSDSLYDKAQQRQNTRLRFRLPARLSRACLGK